MSELNEEWVQSIIKLGLIEEKKRILINLGNAAFLAHFVEGRNEVEWTLEGVRRYADIDTLLRDDKATAKLATEVVKASRK